MDNPIGQPFPSGITQAVAALSSGEALTGLRLYAADRRFNQNI